jgi:hypothetical protein
MTHRINSCRASLNSFRTEPLIPLGIIADYGIGSASDHAVRTPSATTRRLERGRVSRRSYTPRTRCSLTLITSPVGASMRPFLSVFARGFTASKSTGTPNSLG